MIALLFSWVFFVAAGWWLLGSQRKRLEKDDGDFCSGQVAPSSNTRGNSNERDDLHVPYHHERLSMSEIHSRSQRLLQLSRGRRSMRFFSNQTVPKSIIENIVGTACTAPSGAHKQPWVFVAVSDPATKRQIRALVEQEETKNYFQGRMKQSWVDDVKDMVSQLPNTTTSDGDNEHEQKQPRIAKPYLTDAPWIIVVFKQPHGINAATNQRVDHYYVSESVGIACGMLCLAIHNANLCTLTSTPMGASEALRKLLKRPKHEKVFLLLPVGFPAKDATVPYRQLERKPINEVLVWK